MKPELFADNVLEKAERVMDLLSRRQELLASNLANVDTPGYKTIDLGFREALEGELQKPWPLVQTSPGHFSAAAPTPPELEPVEVEGLVSRPDGNNVRFERELLQMTMNKLRFDMAVQWAQSRLKALRIAIDEGRR